MREMDTSRSVFGDFPVIEWTTSCPSSVPLITFSSRLSNDTHVIRDFCLSNSCVGLKLRVRCSLILFTYASLNPRPECDTRRGAFARSLARAWRDRSTFTTLLFLRSQSFTMPSDPPVQICVCRVKAIPRQEHAHMPFADWERRTHEGTHAGSRRRECGAVDVLCPSARCRCLRRESKGQRRASSGSKILLWFSLGCEYQTSSFECFNEDA